MNILIVYATNSGGTQIASQSIQEVLTGKTHTVVVKQAAQTSPPELGQYDLVILGSPSWDYESQEGLPHADFIDLIKKCQGTAFEGKKFAVFGLGDSSYTHFCGAVNHLEEFVTSVKGTKSGESLKIDGFYFNQEKNTELIRSWTEGLSQTLV